MLGVTSERAWKFFFGDAADRVDTDAWLGTAPLDRLLLVGDTIEGTPCFNPDGFDTIARPVIGDGTEEFDDADTRLWCDGDTIVGTSLLIFEGLDTIARPLMGDATEEFDNADTRLWCDTLVTPPPTGNLPLLLLP